jgi:hypothetical protein
VPLALRARCLLPARMAHFISLHALKSQPAEPGAFDLWLPNPVMGRALFLSLPLEPGWTFEFNPAEAFASRYVVYRDRMWVREGRATFFTIQPDSSRVEVNVMVKRWQPRIPECYWVQEGGRERLFRRWLQPDWEEAITRCCCRTERQMRIRWRTNTIDRQPKLTARAERCPPDRLHPSDVERLLSDIQCH